MKLRLATISCLFRDHGQHFVNYFGTTCKFSEIENEGFATLFLGPQAVTKLGEQRIKPKWAGPTFPVKLLTRDLLWLVRKWCRSPAVDCNSRHSVDLPCHKKRHDVYCCQTVSISAQLSSKDNLKCSKPQDRCCGC